MRFPTLLALLCLAVSGAFAQEAAIRKNLAERLPNFPPIDEITKTAVPGVYELRIGTDILYTDERGDHLFQGVLIDTRTRSNLTEARIEKLTAIDFATLPLKDAIAIKQGNGSRKLVIFADPNCGYCKRLERDLMTLKDVTVYNFLYPILGPDSTAKAKDIWCAKDAGRVWRDWMVEGSVPPKVTAKCDTAAIDRNVELGRKYRVQGTPAMVFEDGTRRPGALPAAEVEKLLAAAKKG
jgi:thiol:disulfide interchange protein DsbC